ncbi:MAG: hypothetical protein GY909_08290 [Oligoflexia bacterium]|nr:hypothetical protein [Oligoflexia bacterium]
MVKIKDLTDPQLDSQIKKYKKILGELEKEKNKRLEASGEIAAPKTEQFSVAFDDEEISQMQADVKKEKVKQEEDEQVRVTQLLSLSKEQLQELQDNSKKLKAKEKAGKKKKVAKK